MACGCGNIVPETISKKLRPMQVSRSYLHLLGLVDECSPSETDDSTIRCTDTQVCLAVGVNARYVCVDCKLFNAIANG